MKAFELILSPEADDNLAIIYDHSLDSWGKKHTKSYLDDLEKSFDMLCATPNIGHHHPDIPIIYNVFLVNKHWVIYYTKEKQLIIVAIIHSSMQLSERLDKLLTRL